ncbi:hypothetical protein GLOTRDRAFT_93346 [Gloeophyllum trabeum ATCC 11539]|uniref:Uncharacterized protein n=1 Tax=Gloeophyllum trabeum (strain ATCC 11539 / FP-39264 / Madison 617) TaxID=670483 RepID=S7RRZ4_GLOTA|nr:uncharacterized protein GLOTRDRAFT_93346 [Gloeophyllum trabeum ATCC 11539]EPQ55789.1 hypothetical protein GLOTRDRAFT_93346 [Gloeophyllum trabeum ATCC 11539]
MPAAATPLSNATVPLEKALGRLGKLVPGCTMALKTPPMFEPTEVHPVVPLLVAQTDDLDRHPHLLSEEDIFHVLLSGGPARLVRHVCHATSPYTQDNRRVTFSTPEQPAGHAGKVAKPVGEVACLNRDAYNLDLTHAKVKESLDQSKSISKQDKAKVELVKEKIKCIYMAG